MSPLPPGPSRIGFFERLQYGFQSPEPFLHRTVREFGPTFRINDPTGASTITGDPEAIRALYTADPDSLEARGIEFTAPIFGHNGVTVTSGERHKRDRRLLSAPFHAALKSYGDIIAEITTETFARHPKGQTFSLLDATQSIALDVIIRAVFGVQGKDHVAEVRDAILALVDALHPGIIFFLSLRRDLFGYGPWARFCRAKQALDRLVLREIHTRRAQAQAKEGEKRRDILSLLLEVRDEDGTMLQDEELLDQLRTVLFAGHETTATAMAWALFVLQERPLELAKLRNELAPLGPTPDPNALSTLPYLEAVCQEILRIYPPVVDVGRVVKKELNLGKFTVPAGEAVMASPIILHNQTSLYPEPTRFRPERFLERKFSPFEYIPFGGGARRCLGAAFAMYEMKVVLGTALAGHRFRNIGSPRVSNIRRGLTMGPRGGIPILRD